MNKKLLVIVVVASLVCGLAGYLIGYDVGYEKTSKNSDTSQDGNTSSNNDMDFEKCAAAGNPVQESYPRGCVYNGQTFIEEI